LRRLILLVALAALAHPAGAGTRVTVAQLDQALTAAIAAHKPDADIARQIASLELSERLTEASLNRLNIRLAQDALAAQALALLADRSAFLDPPVAELPVTAAPNDAARQRMLDAARNYVAQTLPRLPDFLATRTITRYDDSPQALKKGAWPVRAGLHLVGTSSREISVRNERKGPGVEHGSAASQEQNGLSTWGEFGFLPGLILADTVKGTVTWSHWERMAAGPAAVFHYAVPHSASHYEIVGTIAHGPKWQPADGSTVRAAAAYRGSLWVDPETGAVLRLTLEIGENGVGQFKRFAVMVQYAPVEIGDRKFICPVRSLASDLAAAGVTSSLFGNSGLTDVPTEWLNVASYSGYHRFASTTRILAGTPETQAEKPQSVSELPQATSPVPDETPSAMESTALPESGLLSPSSPLDSPTDSAPTAPVPAVPAPAVPTPMVAPPTEPTPAVSDARANQPQTTGITLQVNVNKVLIPVVVRDQQGRSVSDLKKEDFQLFDNNKPRAISAFTVEQNASTPGAAPPQRFIVLLFDDLHLSFVDLENAKKAGEKALDGMLQGSNQVAVLSLSGKVASGLTRDRAKLQEAILSLKSQGDYLHINEVCVKIGYLQAWLMEFPQEAAAFHDAAMQLIACGVSSDPKDAERAARLIAQRIVIVMGRDYVESFSAIDEIVRWMATLPGQRALILISPGFEIRDPQVSAAQSQMINLAAQSNVTVSTLSAPGLSTTSVTAGNDNTNGYASRDLPMAESSLSDLADSTGGTFIHNSNDLETGFKSLAEAPEAVYLLELSLDNVKPDVTFHRLKVKVNRNGLQIQARRGYFMPNPDKNKK
jgi:VWFA-related protein